MTRGTPGGHRERRVLPRRERPGPQNERELRQTRAGPEAESERKGVPTPDHSFCPGRPVEKSLAMRVLAQIQCPNENYVFETVSLM